MQTVTRTLEPRNFDYSHSPSLHSPSSAFPMYPGPHQAPQGQPGPQQQQQQHYPMPQPGYGNPASQSGQYPPHQISPNRPEMASIHGPYLPQPQGHPQQPQYYQQQPPDYRGPQPQPQQQQSPQSAAQAAPRQRTAIACKYCRRRKIRCSGFENAADGRCNNCLRFNQECVFTPVSSQTQAFVPAQAVYGRRAGPPQGPPQLYGPYGQPLPPQQYPLPSPGHGPPMQGYPPQGYGPPGYQQGYPPTQYEQPPPPGPGQQNHAAGNRRRREDDEPHTPTLPPPNPGPNANLAGHEQQQYTYPEQQTYAGSPATGQNPYQQGYYPQQAQRTSPSTGYPYEHPRNSNSPHTGQPYYGGPPMQHPQAPPQTQQGRTPPPGADNRNGLAIRDIVSESGAGQGERTAADSDMVSALNRTSRR